MPSFRLYKKEKLCSQVAIDRLFSRGEGCVSALKYPIRAVWRQNPDRSSDSPIAFIVSVPKKRLRHAVDRVAMRRRIREAYRLARHRFPLPPGARIDLAFIYVADSLMPYSSIEASVDNILAKIQEKHLSVPSSNDNDAV